MLEAVWGEGFLSPGGPAEVAVPGNRVLPEIQPASASMGETPAVAEASTIGSTGGRRPSSSSSTRSRAVNAVPLLTKLMEVAEAPLEKVANHEKIMPAGFIRRDGFGITDACRKYLQPLIEGEDYPPYVNGLPAYVSLKNESVPPTLPPFQG